MISNFGYNNKMSQKCFFRPIDILNEFPLFVIEETPEDKSEDDNLHLNNLRQNYINHKNSDIFIDIHINGYNFIATHVIEIIFQLYNVVENFNEDIYTQYYFGIEYKCANFVQKDESYVANNLSILESRFNFNKTFINFYRFPPIPKFYLRKFPKFKHVIKFINQIIL